MAKTKAIAEQRESTKKLPPAERQPEVPVAPSRHRLRTLARKAVSPLRAGSRSSTEPAGELPAIETIGRARLASGLQRSLGNARISRLHEDGVQAKLKVGTPNDAYEREADRVADAALRMQGEGLSGYADSNAATVLGIRRLCQGRDEEALSHQGLGDQRIQPFSSSSQPAEVSSQLETYLHATRGSGKRVQEPLRTSMEQRFGQDFGSVRLHTDLEAGRVAESVSARAFTSGQDIYFGSGQYRPETSDGQRLLAHELTHVVQQSGRSTEPSGETKGAVVPSAHQRPGTNGTAEHLTGEMATSRVIDQVSRFGSGPIGLLQFELTNVQDIQEEVRRLTSGTTAPGTVASTLLARVRLRRRILWLEARRRQLLERHVRCFPNGDCGLVGITSSEFTQRNSRFRHQVFQLRRTIFRHHGDPVSFHNLEMVVDDPMGMHPAVEDRIRIARTTYAFETPETITAESARTGPVSVERTSALTRRHLELIHLPRIAAEEIEEWSTEHSARMVEERFRSPEGRSVSAADYKDRWVRAHRHIIGDVAREYGLPDWLIAGVAWIEGGGEPSYTDDASYALGDLGLRGSRERASYGPVAMQIRRAAEELGYDLETLSRAQEGSIIRSLRDPQQNLFIVGSHLHRLRNIDFPYRSAEMLTEDQVRVIATRYNRGPDLNIEEIEENMSYGNLVVTKRTQLEILLQD